MDEVAWTKRATRNLHDIGEYIAGDSPEAAEHVIRRIAERVAALAFFPHMGRPGRVEGTRELVIADTPYIVIYRVKDRVDILRIRHSAQRWPETI